MKLPSLIFPILTAAVACAAWEPDTMLYGAAYYHEYMPSERLDIDIELMRKAGIPVVRVGESTWTSWEPRDGEFQFGWMDRITTASCVWLPGHILPAGSHSFRTGIGPRCIMGKRHTGAECSGMIWSRTGCIRRLRYSNDSHHAIEYMPFSDEASYMSMLIGCTRHSTA
jgi:hypothetical protein